MPFILSGVALLVLALIVPSAGLIHALRAGALPDDPKLLAGAAALRVALGVLGGYLIVGARMQWWRKVEPAAIVTPAPEWRWTRPVLGLLLISAAVLRLYGLNRGLWVDEVTTLVNYARPPFGEILTTYDSQNQHTLYSLLAHASFRVFGESAWALRLPAALFGIGTIWALYLLGREVTTERESLLAAALLTFSYQHVWFSQSARGYSGSLFWAVLSSYVLVRALRERQPRLWLWFAITVSLGVFTHMTVLFVVMGQFLAYVWVRFTRRHEPWPEKWTPLFGGFVLSGLLTILLYALVLPQILGTTQTEVSEITTWKSPWWTLQEIVRGLDLGSSLGLVALAGLIVVVVGCASYVRRQPIIPILLVFPVALGAGLTIGMGHHLWPRFFFFAAGFGVLVVIRGLMVLGLAAGHLLRWPERRAIWATTAAIVGLIALMAHSLKYVYRPKQDFAGARDFVNQAKEPGDAVVIVGVATLPYRMYYAPEWPSASSLEELEAIRARSQRTWLLYTLPVEMESMHPDILGEVQREFHLIRTFDGSLGGGSIFVYRVDDPGSSSASSISSEPGSPAGSSE